jgi:hypothetical protein
MNPLPNNAHINKGKTYTHLKSIIAMPMYQVLTYFPFNLNLFFGMLGVLRPQNHLDMVCLVIALIRYNHIKDFSETNLSAKLELSSTTEQRKVGTEDTQDIYCCQNDGFLLQHWKRNIHQLPISEEISWEYTPEVAKCSVQTQDELKVVQLLKEQL